MFQTSDLFKRSIEPSYYAKISRPIILWLIDWLTEIKLPSNNCGLLLFSVQGLCPATTAPGLEIEHSLVEQLRNRMSGYNLCGKQHRRRKYLSYPSCGLQSSSGEVVGTHSIQEWDHVVCILIFWHRKARPTTRH